MYKFSVHMQVFLLAVNSLIIIVAGLYASTMPEQPYPFIWAIVIMLLLVPFKILASNIIDYFEGPYIPD